MLNKFLIRSIERYQRTLSPKLYDRGVRCIFEQSCSNYAIAVLEQRNTATACIQLALAEQRLFLLKTKAFKRYVEEAAIHLKSAKRHAQSLR